jgi:hypothetical protein
MTTHGWTASGFEGVRDAFAKNFADGSEVGSNAPPHTSTTFCPRW